MRYPVRLSLVLSAIAIIPTCAMSTTSQPTAASTPESALIPAAPTASAHFVPEVRLRKLHLVRPDLIMYPLAYEVVC